MDERLKKSLGIEKMSSLEVEAFLDKEYKSPGGVEKFAAALAGVIYEDVLYEGKVRQVLDVYEASPGEDVTFDSDVSCPSYVMSMEGLPERNETRSSRVRVDTSPTAVKDLIRWNEINYRKFDIVKRAHERSKAAIMEAEDTAGIAVIDTASTGYHSEISATTTNLLSKIAQGKATLWANGRVPGTTILMNPITEQYLLFPQNASGTPLYVPNTQEALLKQGKIGTIFGMNIVATPVVTAGYVYILGPKEYVGKLVVRTDIETKVQPSIEDFGDLLIFWIDEGCYCRYSKGVLRISYS